MPGESRFPSTVTAYGLSGSTVGERRINFPSIEGKLCAIHAVRPLLSPAYSPSPTLAHVTMAITHDHDQAAPSTFPEVSEIGEWLTFHAMIGVNVQDYSGWVTQTFDPPFLVAGPQRLLLQSTVGIGPFCGVRCFYELVDVPIAVWIGYRRRTVQNVSSPLD